MQAGEMNPTDGDEAVDLVAGVHRDGKLTRDYERLFADIRPRLLRLARLCGVPVEAIEDVVQETLLVAWRKLDQLYSPDGIQPWVLRDLPSCLRPLSAGYLLDPPHGLSHSISSPCLTTWPSSTKCLEHGELQIDSLDPAEVLERHDFASLIEQALHLLPEQAREAD